MSLPQSMTAVVIDGNGDPDVLHVSQLPVPQADAGEIVVEVAAAGVGVWDAGERSGAMAAMLPDEAKHFPRVIGGDGSGTVVAIGPGVDDHKIGDEVYGYAFGSAKGGFYAQYVAMPANQAAPLPAGVDLVRAGALAIPGGTSLRGLADALSIQPGQRIAVFGANGTLGLPAVQLAKAMGVHVLAVVSGKEGLELVRRVGADAAVDSKGGDVAAAVAAFAPDGLDAVLATANGDGLDALTAALKEGGTVAFPHGVQPEPSAPAGRHAKVYEGAVDRPLLERLNALIGDGYEISVSEWLPLERAADAHRLLAEHRQGRPLLIVGS